MSFKSCVRIEHDKLLIPLLKSNNWGGVLDVGSKDSRYRVHMKHTEWESLDIENGCDYKMDICKKHPQKKFNTILCTQVLEHVKEPLKALKNIYSCLKKGGTLILTIPFYHPIHAKQDYWRWTRNGIKLQLMSANFNNIKISSYGSPITVIWQGINQMNLLPNWIQFYLGDFEQKTNRTCHGYLCEATK